jgi:hypothetical protein
MEVLINYMSDKSEDVMEYAVESSLDFQVFCNLHLSSDKSKVFVVLPHDLPEDVLITRSVDAVAEYYTKVFEGTVLFIVEYDNYADALGYLADLFEVDLSKPVNSNYHEN